MRKNFAEMLDKFETLQTEDERIKYLRENIDENTVKILQGAYRPDVQFTVTEIPKFSGTLHAPGMGFSTLAAEVRRLYLFEKNNPRRPQLSEKRHRDLLAQMFDAIEGNEKEVLKRMFMKEPLAKNLTLELLQKTFPGHWFGQMKEERTARASRQSRRDKSTDQIAMLMEKVDAEAPNTNSS